LFEIGFVSYFPIEPRQLVNLSGPDLPGPPAEAIAEVDA